MKLIHHKGTEGAEVLLYFSFRCVFRNWKSRAQRIVITSEARDLLISGVERKQIPRANLGVRNDNS